MDEITKTRQRKCCPKCKSTRIKYRTALRKYTCEDCKHEFYRSAAAYKEMTIYSTMPKYWQQIMGRRKAEKKAAEEAVTA